MYNATIGFFSTIWSPKVQDYWFFVEYYEFLQDKILKYVSIIFHLQLAFLLLNHFDDLMHSQAPNTILLIYLIKKKNKKIKKIKNLPFTFSNKLIWYSQKIELKSILFKSFILLPGVTIMFSLFNINISFFSSIIGSIIEFSMYPRINIIF